MLVILLSMEVLIFYLFMMVRKVLSFLGVMIVIMCFCDFDMRIFFVVSVGLCSSMLLREIFMLLLLLVVSLLVVYEMLVVFRFWIVLMSLLWYSFR